MTVRADVRGLRPSAQFGFHVHEKGDCSSPDGMAAGEHFNPTGKPHAHYSVAERHAGDLIEPESDAEGVAVYAFETNLAERDSRADIGRWPRRSSFTRSPMITAHNRQATQARAIACGLIRAV